MSGGLWSYCGRADLILVYDQAAGVVIERPRIQVVLNRVGAVAPVEVLLDRRWGVAQRNGLPLRRAVVVLLNGTVLSGPVQAVDESGEYFEIVAGAYTTQGNDQHV